MQNNLRKPLLSIITINRNNADGLAKTMTSVIAQTFTDKEYIVIDGGSSDESVDIIRRENLHLSYWISEADKGVYNAMNKGIGQARGEYLLFLNSGDYLVNENILESVREVLSTGTDIIYGDLFLEKDNEIYYEKKYPPKLTFKYFYGDLESLPHPSTFVKRTVFDKVGLYNESFKIVSDWELVLKALFLQQMTYQHVSYAISVFNMEGVSSLDSNQKVTLEEKEYVYKKYFSGFIDDYEEMITRSPVVYNVVSIRKSFQHSFKRKWHQIKHLFRS